MRGYNAIHSHGTEVNPHEALPPSLAITDRKAVIILVCVCVCERERAREREKEKQRGKDKERGMK